MTVRAYASPNDFKQAFEHRLRLAAKARAKDEWMLSASKALEHRVRAADGAVAEFSRRRQLLVIERWLARVMAVLGDAAMLKGGFVLELRRARPRPTKDVDLRILGSPGEILATLQEAGRRDLGDFMTFEVGPDDDHPEIRNDGAQYDGLRFHVECKLAGKVYGQPFETDVAVGDPVLGEPDVLVAQDVLGFAGIAPPTLRLYPVETHIAEKFHAYTMPRSRPNSRVKDLPDLALLSRVRAIDAGRLRAALEQTFDFRRTHPLPAEVPAPLSAWTTPYAAMARENEFAWPTLGDVTAEVKAFLDPVLAYRLDATWNLHAWKLRYQRSALPPP